MARSGELEIIHQQSSHNSKEKRSSLLFTGNIYTYISRSLHCRIWSGLRSSEVWMIRRMSFLDLSNSSLARSSAQSIFPLLTAQVIAVHPRNSSELSLMTMPASAGIMRRTHLYCPSLAAHIRAVQPSAWVIPFSQSYNSFAAS